MLYQKQMLLQRVVDIYLSQFLTPSPKSKKKKTNLKNLFIFSQKEFPPHFGMTAD